MVQVDHPDGGCRRLKHPVDDPYELVAEAVVAEKDDRASGSSSAQFARVLDRGVLGAAELAAWVPAGFDAQPAWV
jgi:hypothetical protein